MTVRLYVEGGGDSKALRTACRRGFAELLSKAGLAGRMPRIIACGSRTDAYRDFCTAVRMTQHGVAVLLVDSEDPVNATTDPWAHLRGRDGWHRPRGAGVDACHLMVECMEAWFLADRQALVGTYGPRFRVGALPRKRQVEQIAKSDVFRTLEQATRDSRRGPYRKGEQSFLVLERLDPARLEQAAPHARRFFDALRALAAEDAP